ncbi:MAG TPA: TIGR02757 family protein [Bacteroidales bacterium]|nr:TIGR02757 family protein [Bacteroidales bacterium]HPS17048.1 TIGR02757 family protein [Bacteroidales bacterium]
MDEKSLKKLLDLKYKQFNTVEFISSDPVSIPHLFSKKEDIEISGFLTSTIAWGQRTTIIKNSLKLMDMMDMNPHDYVLNANKYDLRILRKFVHRTFNGNDCLYFIKSLKHIYKKYGSLENAFLVGYDKDKTIRTSIIEFRKIFFSLVHDPHTEKHISDPLKNSSCKRLNLFLRWMVRKDNNGVDFGIWKKIPSSALLCPLDLHTGNVSRELRITTRTKNDWIAVEEITDKLKKFDPTDPAKYDFALFGIGVNNIQK